MTWIKAADPLALLAIQAGQINTPVSNTAAESTSPLDVQQRFTAIGEPVPIVFARFRNSKGGILISPGATEARFENNANNDVTAYYHLVLSEGQIDSIPVKDVKQRACRTGTHTQTYSRRAGTWTPGNFIVQRAGKTLPLAPYFCGSIGQYPSISTLSYNVTIPDGFDYWNRQVHLFIRGGIRVTRLFDSTVGPSDNFADLVKWLLENTARVPSSIIDTTTLTSTATFLEYNGFTCNCYLQESTNYAELVSRWAPYFLLCESNINGKRGLRPLLPTLATGALNTGSITPKYVFTEAMVIANSFELEYVTYSDRQPFVCQVIWRQQIDGGIGITRTAEVSYTGTATAGPYETHDLSAFCTNETHAVKVGAYILAKRYYTTHTIRFAARPEAHNAELVPGDIIRVELQREATNYAISTLNYLYQVERITKTLAGDVSYECTHFPVDNQNRSLVALDVAGATATGLIISDAQTGISCDTNSSSDNTIPLEQYTLGPGTYNGQYAYARRSEGSGSGGSTGSDGLDGGGVGQGFLGAGTTIGTLLTAPNPCPGNAQASVLWYYGGTEQGFTQATQGILNNNSLIIGSLEMTAAYPSGDYTIRAIWYCPGEDGTVSQTIYEQYIPLNTPGPEPYSYFLYRSPQSSINPWASFEIPPNLVTTVMIDGTNRPAQAFEIGIRDISGFSVRVENHRTISAGGHAGWYMIGYYAANGTLIQSYL